MGKSDGWGSVPWGTPRTPRLETIVIGAQTTVCFQTRGWNSIKLKNRIDPTQLQQFSGSKHSLSSLELYIFLIGVRLKLCFDCGTWCSSFSPGQLRVISRFETVNLCGNCRYCHRVRNDPANPKPRSLATFRATQRSDVSPHICRPQQPPPAPIPERERNPDRYLPRTGRPRSPAWTWNCRRWSWGAGRASGTTRWGPPSWRTGTPRLTWTGGRAATPAGPRTCRRRWHFLVGSVGAINSALGSFAWSRPPRGAETCPCVWRAPWCLCRL